MSTTLVTLLNAVTANTTGTPLDLSTDERYQGGQHSVAVSGTFSANVLFEASVDGSTWYTIATVTAAGLATYPGSFHSIRASVTGYVSGTITCTARYAQIHSGIDTLLARLTAARAGYLDELAAANLPADVDTLLARLTAARALLLDNLSRLDVTVSTLSTATGLDALTRTLRKVAKLQQF